MRVIGTALTLLMATPQLMGGEGLSVPTAVAFVSRAGLDDNPVTRLSRGARGSWGVLDVHATIQAPPGAGYDDYVVLASIEACVAPHPLPSELEGKDPVDEVGWAYIATMPTVASVVLHSVPPQASRHVKPISIDIDGVLRKTFGDPNDRLWPYAFRATVFVLDRNAHIIGRDSAVVRIGPS